MITRFAPSPTGPLHLGHAYSAVLAHDMAQEHGGKFLLRIEDIDQSRARAQWEQQIYDDLEWLGLTWEMPVRRQSDHMNLYAQALDKLWKTDWVYPCYCSRADIRNALSAPQEGVTLIGPDGPVYPGICPIAFNDLPPSMSPRPESETLRISVHAFEQFMTRNVEGACMYFTETGAGPKGESGIIAVSASQIEREVGDFVIARKDMGTSYHLSVVLDDAAQGVSHVVRGNDLFEATRIHVLLQKALGLPTPIYHHHKLIRDDAGKRLAKRDDARAISTYRAQGASPQDIRKLIGLP